MEADFEAQEPLCKKLADLLTQAKEAKITSRLGTNITLSLAGRKGRVSRKKRSAPRKRLYDTLVFYPLRTIWLAADGICGKRLAPFIPELLPVLKRIPNQIEKSFWIQRLSRDLRAKEADVLEELKKTKLEEDIYGLEPEEIINLPPKSHKDLLEERLLTLVLRSPENIDLVIEKCPVSLLSLPGQAILTGLKQDGKFSAENLSPEIQSFFNCLSLKAEIEKEEGGIDEKEIIPEIQFCLQELASGEIKRELGEVSEELKRAETEKDQKKVDELSQHFNQLAKTLKND